jgi:hypothetical protein
VPELNTKDASDNVGCSTALEGGGGREGGGGGGRERERGRREEGGEGGREEGRGGEKRGGGRRGRCAQPANTVTFLLASSNSNDSEH